MKRNLVFIIIIGLLSIVTLYIFKSSTDNPENNGFSRKFRNPHFKLKKAIKLKDKTFMFFSLINDSIMMHSYSDWKTLYCVTDNENKIDTSALKFPPRFHAKSIRIHKDILGDKLYAINPEGDLSIFIKDKVFYYKLKNFVPDRFAITSPYSFITRSIRYDGNIPKRELLKINISDTPQTVQRYDFPDLVNHFFANDGMLHYNRENQRILYMFYYSGRFLCLDTNLKVLYKSKTVDTIKTAKIKSKTLKSKDKNNQKQTQLVLSGPPKFVNSFITSKGNFIYLTSGIKADNQKVNDFDQNYTIDVYNISSGKYDHSFYIPKFGGLKLKEFLIKENSIVILCGDHMITYSFSNKI